MRKLLVYNQVSLDGFIADANGDMGFAHKSDPEWDQYVAGNAGSGGQFLFGRITYDMMASFWPTPMAKQQFPVVAKTMNEQPKVVFSRTMGKPAWNNTTLVKNDMIGAVRKMKNEPGPGMVIFGSGTIVSQLANENLIDEFQMVVNPVVLGSGKSMFAGLNKRLNLEMVSTRTFKNGNVVITYQTVV